MNIQRQKTKVYFQIPIYPALKPLLVELHNTSGTPKTGKVFKVTNPKKAIATACRVLGYPHFTARNFRQMGIVELLRSGIDVKLVSRWQGHQDGGVLIMNTYSQVISETDSDYELDQLKRLEPKTK
jgi:integrase